MASISFEVSGTEQLSQRLDELGSALARAVRQQAEYVRDEWQDAVEARGESRADVYAEVLGDWRAIEHLVSGDLLHSQVVIRDARIRRIEEGGPEWDMKPGLLKNARTTKKGGRYNIIPLRDGVFRAVSSRSPASSWIYPAQNGLNVIPEVVSKVTPEITKALRQVIEEWKR